MRILPSKLDNHNSFIVNHGVSLINTVSRCQFSLTHEMGDPQTDFEINHMIITILLEVGS